MIKQRRLDTNNNLHSGRIVTNYYQSTGRSSDKTTPLNEPATFRSPPIIDKMQNHQLKIYKINQKLENHY